MAYQETTRTSYGTRVGNSFKGILTGLLMLVGGTVLLWWNEGRSVRSNDATADAYEATQILSDISSVDASMNGQMVLATGTANTNDILTDGLFGVSENATRLIRKVEYYQWVEHSSSKSEDKLGGAQETTTTYTYDMQWVRNPVNSAHFKDPAYQGRNTVIREFPEETHYAENVFFGAYTLPTELISQMHTEDPAVVNASSPALNALKSSLANKAVTVSGNIVYIGGNMSAPQVGDVRVTFTKVRPSNMVTVWAKVNGNTFSAYVHKNGNKIFDLYTGSKTLDEVKQNAEEANSTLTWILRIVGILIIYGGFSNLFGLLVTLLKVIPALSSIASVGTSLVSGVLAAIWSLIIIIMAWIFYRPLLAIFLLALVGALVYYLVMRSKKAKEGAAPTDEITKAE